MYKEALRLKLRFSTDVGTLTTEQLWGLTLSQLDKVAVELEENSTKNVRKSFISDVSEEDKIENLKFEIVLDILKTKLDVQRAQRDAIEAKAHNEKILNILSERKDRDLNKLSDEELEKMLIK